MSKRHEDYHSVVEQIIRDPESYNQWSLSSKDSEREELKELIKESFDAGDNIDY
jgi:hypothetical protein